MRTSLNIAAAAVFTAAVLGVAADPGAARVVDPAALIAHIHHAAAMERLAGGPTCADGSTAGHIED
jgi:hypothetical protein